MKGQATVGEMAEVHVVLVAPKVNTPMLSLPRTVRHRLQLVATGLSTTWFYCETSPISWYRV